MEWLCTQRVHQFCPGGEYDTCTFRAPSPIPPTAPEPRDRITIELLRENICNQLMNGGKSDLGIVLIMIM